MTAMRTALTLVSSAGLLAGLASSAAAQVLFPREELAVVHGWVEGSMIEEDITGQQTYKHEGWRKKMLEQFPDADADGDRTLTEAEAIQYHMAQVRMFSLHGQELDQLPEGARHETVLVEMRDGAKLPVEVFLPAGEGPWPVVLVRTSRGRIDSALDYGNELLRKGYAFVGGDLTPQGDFVDADVLGRPTGRQELSREQRAQMNARRAQRNAGEDGYDTIVWIARQPWSNGRIAVSGYSEASSQAKNAVAQHPPHLTAAVTAIGTLSRERSEVRSAGRRALGDDGQVQLPENWSPPESDPRGGADLFAGGALERNGAPEGLYFNDRTGWFDFAVQGSIDEWNALKDNGRSILIMGIGGHGPLHSGEGSRLPPAFGDCDIILREAEQFGWLTGEIKPEDVASVMVYFLMGDATNPEAPGNVWKVTDTWPVPNTPTGYYLAGDGTLSTSEPEESGEPITYAYDPKDPVVTFMGDRMPSNLYGPRNQSHLADRQDILRFETEPLTQPVEITGRPVVELYVSTDAPDTTFMAYLVDIYPDGFEWPIRDSAAMLRFRGDNSEAVPAEAGEVYKLTMTLTSTAVMVDKGHKIGLRVTSSHYPAYEVHPNTWEAIDSYHEAKVANNAVHVSAEHPSRVILPVVAPGISHDYQPGKTPVEQLPQGE